LGYGSIEATITPSNSVKSLDQYHAALVVRPCYQAVLRRVHFEFGSIHRIIPRFRDEDAQRREVETLPLQTLLGDGIKTLHRRG
jgi:hypothetical protein